MESIIQGVYLTPLKHIQGSAGDIFHIMRNDGELFKRFGEVYISTIRPGHIKGWKRHKKMTLNIAVPSGRILFVLYDNRKNDTARNKIQEIILSPDEYNLLTVPPGIWMAFKCETNTESFLINFADIVHDPSESDTLDINNDTIPYEWK